MVGSDGSPLASIVARLHHIRTGQFGPESGLERMAPGVAPAIDIQSLGLHTVRESALGALADLELGEAGRACRTIDLVLGLQLDAPGQPWHGTWPVTAEQPDPPTEGAIEWVHYDPNWRQFLGSILAVIVELHGSTLGERRQAQVVQAVARAVAGEPADRIPPWYTNPALLHAWITAWVGVQIGDPTLVAAGEARAATIRQRVDQAGDIDEYNSPTYDGIDLLALALWVRHPPSPAFVDHGGTIMHPVVNRVARLFHGGIGVMCGPYIRAYGLDLGRSVALVSLWLVAAGAPAALVLPEPLDAATDHVHDLWFAPMVGLLAEPVIEAWPPDLTLPRRHVQAFGPIEAVSVVERGYALGAERGRRPDFARDQHVPVTVHTASTWMGVVLGPGVAGVDAVVAEPVHRFAPPGSAPSVTAGSGDGAEHPGHGLVRAEVVPLPGASEVEVSALWSEPPTLDGGRIAAGEIEMRCSPGPESVAIEDDSQGVRVTLGWSAPVAVSLEIAVSPR